MTSRSRIVLGLIVLTVVLVVALKGLSPAVTATPTVSPRPTPTPTPVPTAPPATPTPAPTSVPCGSSLQDRIDATATRGLLNLTGCSYSVSGPATVSRAMTIQGGTVQGSSGGLRISASGVTVTGMTLRGPGYSADRGHIAIEVTGGSATSYVQAIKLTHNTISGWDGEGIHAEFVDGFDVSDNDISNIWYAGIGGSSVQHGTINRNWVHNIIGTGNAYGIYLSRGYGGGLTRNPRSSDVQVDSNTIEDIPNWEGLDTHAGQRLQFTNNTIRRVLNPITIGSSKDSDTDPLYYFAPLAITASGNRIESQVTDGSLSVAISVSGANAGDGLLGASNELAEGVAVTGNTIIGFGEQSNPDSGAIRSSDTSHLTISGNTIDQASPAAIQIYLNNYDFSVTDNTIRDPWSDALDYAYGIYVHVDYNVGIVADNRFVRGDKEARTVLTGTVEVNAYPHNAVDQR